MEFIWELSVKTDRAVIGGRLATPTPREHEALDIIVNGEKPGMSEKTVEFHRANIMRKLEARSLAGTDCSGDDQRKDSG